MKTLRDIYEGVKSLTDKGTAHTYVEMYEVLLAPYRHNRVAVLEVGVKRGGSIAMWSAYFTSPAATIVGLDINDCWKHLTALDDRRVIHVVGDSTDPAVAAKFSDLDVVIDDGSHEPGDQAATFRNFWPRMSPGGLYVVEDVKMRLGAERVLAAVHPFVIHDRRRLANREDDVLAIAYKD